MAILGHWKSSESMHCGPEVIILPMGRVVWPIQFCKKKIWTIVLKNQEISPKRPYFSFSLKIRSSGCIAACVLPWHQPTGPRDHSSLGAMCSICHSTTCLCHSFRLPTTQIYNLWFAVTFWKKYSKTWQVLCPFVLSVRNIFGGF